MASPPRRIDIGTGPAAGKPEGRPHIGSLHWLLLVPALLLAWAVTWTIAGWVLSTTHTGERPPASGSHAIATVAREAVVRTLFAMLHPLGWVPAGPPRPNDDDPADTAHLPVLLVPGLGANRSSMWFFQTFLARRGWRWVWPVNRGPRKMEPAAEILGTRVRQLVAATGIERVDIVAFAEGGLVAARALHADPTLVPHVRRLVTLGTPWLGSHAAIFGLRPGWAEVRVGSPALRGLWPPPVPVWAIWGDADPAVIPTRSAAPESPPPPAQTCLSASGHYELLASAAAYRAAESALAYPALATTPLNPGLDDTSPTLVPGPQTHRGEP